MYCLSLVQSPAINASINNRNLQLLIKFIGLFFFEAEADRIYDTQLLIELFNSMIEI